MIGGAHTLILGCSFRIRCGNCKRSNSRAEIRGKHAKLGRKPSISQGSSEGKTFIFTRFWFQPTVLPDATWIGVLRPGEVIAIRALCVENSGRMLEDHQPKWLKYRGLTPPVSQIFALRFQFQRARSPQPLNRFQKSLYSVKALGEFYRLQ